MAPSPLGGEREPRIPLQWAVQPCSTTLAAEVSRPGGPSPALRSALTGNVSAAGRARERGAAGRERRGRGPRAQGDFPTLGFSFCRPSSEQHPVTRRRWGFTSSLTFEVGSPWRAWIPGAGVSVSLDWPSETGPQGGGGRWV